MGSRFSLTAIRNAMASVSDRIATAIDVIKSIVPFYKPKTNIDIAKILSAVGLTSLTVGLNVYLPILFRKINEAKAAQTPEEVNNHYQDQLTFFITAYVAGWTVAQLGQNARRLLISNITGNATHAFQVEAMRKFSQLSHADYVKLNVGEISGATQRAADSTRMLSEVLLSGMIPQGVEVALSAITLSQLYDNAYCGLGVLTVLGLCSTYTLSTMDLKKKAEEHWKEHIKLMDATNQNLLQNFETVHLYNNWDYELKRLQTRLDATNTAATKRNAMYEITPSGQSIILAIAVGLTLSKLSSSKQSAEDFNTLNLMMINLVNAITQFGYSLNSVRQAVTLMEESTKMLVAKQSTDSFLQRRYHTLTSIARLGSSPVLENGLTLEFDRVKFSYASGPNVLDQVSFKLEPGTMTALLGRSGSGKSSISRLIFKWYAASEGDILINGRSIQSYSADEFTRKVAICSQESSLPGDTIYDTLSYGSNNVTFTQVEQLVERLGLQDYIERQVDGYQTLLKNLKPSGGEKQRMGIIRAMLKPDVQLYIFDEPTSALDPSVKQQVMACIQELARNKTVMLITHDRDVVQECDQVVILEKGKVLQQGTPAELLKVEGMYKQFCAGQLSIEDSPEHISPRMKK